MAVTPQLAVIAGGEFLMGKDGSRADEAPAHLVRLRPFRAALSPVTNVEYAAFVVATGAAAAPFVQEERFAGPQQPVVGTSWNDAAAYCGWLQSQTGVAFRLPTEAEREFAALGGLTSGDWPWSGENAGFVAHINALEGPHMPTDDCANGYGLRCMAENVHEWCSDWYSASYYGVSPAEQPEGPPSGVRRASRGGSWRHREKTTRINARSSLVPDFHYADFGFRVYADA